MAVQKTPRMGMETYTAGSDTHPARAKFNSERQLIDALTALAAQGSTGARPAPGTINRLYWDTTVKRLYWDDGAAWNEITTNGGGGAGKPILPGVAASEGVLGRSARADHTHLLALATSTVDGAMAKGDKAKLDAASMSGTPATIAMRDSNGNLNASTPTASTHVANKSYVDAKTWAAADVTSGVFDWARMPDPVPLAATNTNLNNYVTTGMWHQSMNAGAAAGTNYPSNYAGLLEVATASGMVYQRYTEYSGRKTYWRGKYSSSWSAWAEVSDTTHTHSWAEITGKPSTFTPSSHNHSGSDITSGTISPARIANASSATDGLMSKSDKMTLDAATASATGLTIMQRNAAGQVAVTDPGHPTHAASKGYVDGKTWSGSDITYGTISPARIANASSSTDGLMSRSDKISLDSATVNSTPSTIAMRDSSGRLATTSNPTSSTHAASKGYVDGEVSTRAASNHTHTWNSITGKPSTFTPSSHNHSGSDITSGTISPARIQNANSTIDGLMSNTDKNAVDQMKKALPYAMATGAKGSLGVHANGEYKITRITFPLLRFSSAPTVTATPNSAQMSCAITNISTSGFDLTTANYSGSTGPNFGVGWQAVQD